MTGTKLPLLLRSAKKLSPSCAALAASGIVSHVEILYGCSRPSALAEGPKREADVDHVGRLRAFVVLVGLDRLDFIARSAVGIQFVDGDAVFRFVAVDQRAVPAPVARQGDDGERALFFRQGR